MERATGYVVTNAHGDPSVAERIVKSLRIACLSVLAAPILWSAALGGNLPFESATCSHALDRGESPPQLAAPAHSGSGNAWSDLRVGPALPGAERPSLPRHLLVCPSSFPDGATVVEEGVLHCASVHPPPLA